MNFEALTLKLHVGNGLQMSRDRGMKDQKETTSTIL